MFELLGFGVAFVVLLIVTLAVFVGLRFGGLDLAPMRWYWWIIGVGAISFLWMKLFEISPIVIGVS